METAEEWAAYFGTKIMTEQEYLELWDSMVHPEITQAACVPLDGKTPEEVEEFFAVQRSMGDGRCIVGVLRPYSGPDDIVDSVPHDSLRPPHAMLLRDWNTPQSREQRTKVRLVSIYPDPHPQLMDPTTVAFTPEMLIAQVKERAVSRPVFGSGSSLVGPITQIQAALMTVPEVGPLLDHGIPPGRPGTVPGVLVCLVLIRGMFGPGMFFGKRPPGSDLPGERWMYEVHNTRDGRAFWTGGGRAHWDITLEYGVSWTA
jgi:hypothetical protein